MNSLTVEVEADKKRAETILASILPEIEADIHERSSVGISYDGRIRLTITAKDLTAMRAAANTYVRWLDMCMKITG